MKDSFSNINTLTNYEVANPDLGLVPELYLVGEETASEDLKTVQLTKREIEIMIYICLEMTTKQIAMKLHISDLTVHNHRYNIMKKIGKKNLAGIIIYTIRSGLFVV